MTDIDLSALRAQRDTARNERDYFHTELRHLRAALQQWCQWQDEVLAIAAAAPEVLERIKALEPLPAECEHVGQRDRARSMAIGLRAANDLLARRADEVTRAAAERAELEAREDASDPWMQVATLRAALQRAETRLAEHARTGLASDADELMVDTAEDLRLVLAVTDPAAGR